MSFQRRGDTAEMSRVSIFRDRLSEVKRREGVYIERHVS